MRCPFCSHEETQVVETRESDEGDVIRRRRRNGAHRGPLAIGWPSDGVTDSTEICIIFRMKTTLDINDQLLANAKALAAQQRTSLTRLIEEGLQLRLRMQAAAPPRGKQRVPVIKGRGGLLAGVDPLSNKAMLEALGDDA